MIPPQRNDVHSARTGARLSDLLHSVSTTAAAKRIGREHGRSAEQMTTQRIHHRTRYPRSAAPQPVGMVSLARLDQDLVDLHRAEELLAQARRVQREDPRAAFEAVHRAALRGAGILVRHANHERRRKLPLNVWVALERIGGAAAARAAEVVPLVAERARLERDAHAVPDPMLLRRHLEQTASHLERVAELVVPDLPMHMTALTG